MKLTKISIQMIKFRSCCIIYRKYKGVKMSNKFTAPILYNEANIANWKKELKDVESWLEKNKIPFEKAQKLLSEKLKKHKSQLKDIDAHIDSIAYRSSYIPWYGYDSYLHSTSSFSYPYSSSCEILPDLYSNYHKLSAEIQKEEKELADKTSLLTIYNLRFQTLSGHIKKGTVFLEVLRNNPQILIDNLISKIESSFQKYDLSNPFEDSVEVKIGLSTIVRRLQFIQMDKDSLKPSLLIYLDLCALLQDMRLKVANENKDHKFLKELDKLLCTTYIQDTLPDELNLDNNTSNRYKILIEQNQDLFNISEVDLQKMEIDTYNNLLTKLSSLKNPNLLNFKIQAAVYEVNKEIELKNKKNLPINYHFYNQILSDLYYIQNNPEHHSVIQHLTKLADLAQGKPILSKKIVGALFAVIGVALIAASLTCLAFTFGGSSLASAMGVTVGLSMINSQIALGVCASIGFFSGSCISACSGRMIQNGMRQGLSKELKSVTNEATSQLKIA